MNTTVSTKYQIVIPKAIRKQLGIRPGQKMSINMDKKGQLVVRKTTDDIDALLDKYAGIARGAWGQDPAATIRKMRDEEWD